MSQGDHYLQEVLAQLRVEQAETATRLKHLDENSRRLSGRLREIEQCIGQLITMAHRIGYGLLTALLVAANADPQSAAQIVLHILEAASK